MDETSGLRSLVSDINSPNVYSKRKAHGYITELKHVTAIVLSTLLYDKLGTFC